MFHADSVGTSGRGVSMTVDGVTSGCGGILHSRTGSLASPNYPSAYAANVECEWEIRVEPGYKVQASFYQRFDLENSTDCRNDFVEVESIHLSIKLNWNFLIEIEWNLVIGLEEWKLVESWPILW